TSTGSSKPASAGARNRRWPKRPTPDRSRLGEGSTITEATVNFIRSQHTPDRLREHLGTVTYSGIGRATRNMIEDRLDQIRLRFEVLRHTFPQSTRRHLVRG